jgi:hypothetical protein
MLIWRGEVLMPGGRVYKFVWVDGKPPRYWTICAIALLLFALGWLTLAHFFLRFGLTHPDAMHSSSRVFDDKVYYFPAAVLWLHDYGLFVVMAWMFVLALIMAFHRRMVPRT